MHWAKKQKKQPTNSFSALFQKAWKFLPFSSPSPFHKSFACRAVSLGSLILLSKVNRPPVQRQMNNKQRGKEKKKSCCQLGDFFFSMFNFSKKIKMCKLCPKGDPAQSFLAAPTSSIPPHITTDTPSFPMLFP